MSSGAQWAWPNQWEVQRIWISRFGMELKAVTRPEMDDLGSHGKFGCNGSNAGMHWQKG